MLGGGVYEFGQTYVSFGFVDFFQIMFGCHSKIDDVSARLRYLCFDRCPIIVARAHVILKLLKTERFKERNCLKQYQNC